LFQLTFLLLSGALISQACRGDVGETGAGACPSEEPQAGSSCANEGQSCQYGVCSESEAQPVYTCRTGSWRADPPRTCAPCPSDIVNGSTCDPTLHVESCRRLNTCGGFDLATCENDRWVFRTEASSPVGGTLGGSSTVAGSAVGTTGGSTWTQQSSCPVTFIPTVGGACCSDSERCVYVAGQLQDFTSTGNTSTGNTATSGGGGFSSRSGAAGAAGAAGSEDPVTVCRRCGSSKAWESCD
jgi:hypothetical protein